MGCAQSKIENEESVARCKDRKNLMKDAVVARNLFAAGHSGYAVALKNTGAALSDYGHGEVVIEPDHQQPPSPLNIKTPQPPPPPPLHIDQLPPPPPPLPNFSPSPIKRAVSMPAIPLDRKIGRRRRNSEIGSMVIEEEEEEVEELHRNEHHVGKMIKNDSKMKSGNHHDMNTPPPPPPTAAGAWDYFFMVDNMDGMHSLSDTEEGLNDIDNNKTGEEGNHNNVNYNDDVEPKTPELAEVKLSPMSEMEEVELTPPPQTPPTSKLQHQQAHIEHSKTAPAFFNSRTVISSINMMQVLSEIDDHFLRASQCAQDVSKMLEATRMHYHSNFADNRGYIDHSARVMRVITWNKSFKGVANGEGKKDDPDSEEYETHATVLDKLLAWEKKLYEEVKQGELMKFEYKRKVALLNKQKKRNVSAETLEKTKAAVSHLHTRYIVDMQSMDSTVSEVNRLRDEQLYPKLVALVDGMAKMWGNMCAHHDGQLKIVTDLKALDIAQAPKETTKHHHEQTKQLLKIVQDWQSQFENLVTYQKQYIQHLNSWLKLNLIPIESSLKEKVLSPPRVQNPPIQAILYSWHDSLEKLPDEQAKSAILAFAAVIETIILHQQEEMKLKEKCEETRKEFLRKNQAFEDWYQKYMNRRNPTDQMEGGDDANSKDPVSERQFVVESLKKRLEEEVETHQRHCLQVREKSMGSLKIRLPELFRSMFDYSKFCYDAYEKLRLVCQSQKSNGGPH
ncbi:hypothetical protein ACFE04_017140 [Oxalis oulophora]